MEVLRTLATLLPLSLTSGINFYATVLIVGLSIRLNWVSGVPDELAVLGSSPVLIIAGFFYIMEFLADKVQFVDNLWDVIHTFVRPLGAAMIGFAALGDADPVVMVVSGIVMGGTALVSHGGKASSRAAMNVVSPAENVSNVFVSLAEDVAVGVLAFLALKYPYVATGIALVLMLLIIIFVPRFIGWAWFTVRAAVAWVQGRFQRNTGDQDTLPDGHLEVLEQQTPEVSTRCQAYIKGARRASGRKGFVSLVGDRLAFTYNTHAGSSELWQVNQHHIQQVMLYQRRLINVLELHYQDEKRKERTASFVFLKDRTPQAENLLARLGGSVAA
jgi:hypothetical protein